MTLYKNKYRIEPDRCQFWNYSSPNSYFITICVQYRKHILGKIANRKMILSGNGKIVAGFFMQLPFWHKRIVLDEWIVMPNHFHCLITLGDYGFDNGVVWDDGGGDCAIAVEKIHEFSLTNQSQPNQPFIPPPPTTIQNSQLTPQELKLLNRYQKIKNPTTDQIKQYRKLRRKMLIPKIMGKLQMQTSKHINLLNNTSGNKTWQPGYHDHIVRGDSEFLRIKYYIRNNPKNWNEDMFNY